jgi:regulator of protease activity HflC (stomatin/prohibitin superfamily)
MNDFFGFGFYGIIVFFLATLIMSGIRILNEYERGVLLTLGRYTGTKGPGLIWVWPVIQKMSRVDLRTIVMDVPPQDVITRDNVTVKVNAVVYFRVVDPSLAILQVVHYFEATSQLAQTTLRSVLGQHDLDALLAEREVLNRDIQAILDKATDAWGIKVTTVEIKHVDLNENMVRAIARQAEAERERRSKVIHAEGELQAAAKLTEAAAQLAKEPQALQLRYMQTLIDISAEKNSTILFPLPMDLITPFLKGPSSRD